MTTSTFYQNRMRIGGVSVFQVQDTASVQFVPDEFTQTKTIIFAGTITTGRNVVIPALDGVEYNLINLCAYAIAVSGSVSDANSVVVSAFSAINGAISAVYCKGELNGTAQFVASNSYVVAGATSLAGDVTGTLGANKVTTITGSAGNVAVAATSFAPGGAFTWQMPSNAINQAYSVSGGAGNISAPTGGSINEQPGATYAPAGTVDGARFNVWNSLPTPSVQLSVGAISSTSGGFALFGSLAASQITYYISTSTVSDFIGMSDARDLIVSPIVEFGGKSLVTEQVVRDTTGTRIKWHQTTGGNLAVRGAQWEWSHTQTVAASTAYTLDIPLITLGNYWKKLDFKWFLRLSSNATNYPIFYNDLKCGASYALGRAYWILQGSYTSPTGSVGTIAGWDQAATTGIAIVPSLLFASNILTLRVVLYGGSAISSTIVDLQHTIVIAQSSSNF